LGAEQKLSTLKGLGLRPVGVHWNKWKKIGGNKERRKGKESGLSSGFVLQLCLFYSDNKKKKKKKKERKKQRQK